MRVSKVGGVPLVPLIENDVMSLVDSGALDAQLPQGANDHLGVQVACEIAAGTCDAPIKIALIMEDSTSAGASTYKVDRTDARGLAVFGVVGSAGGVEDVQIDLRPRVLVSPDDDARPVHVKKQNSAVGGALAQNVVFDREVEVRVAAARNVTLQLVGGVGELLCEGRVLSGRLL